MDYGLLVRSMDERAATLRALGIGRGHRVGIRLPSGTADLYLWILASMAAGAAYVPVDFDDPAARAAVVFDEAQVAVVVGEVPELKIRTPIGVTGSDAGAQAPTPADDAWIIFTSGSTGTPKGVAVTHRSAAALVDAEARLFLQEAGTRGLGPGDRVLAGLSVAFDASCEEMWLAWRHGAALVPAPRSLVKSGADLGQWLAANDITVVSTVPTLAALWPADSLTTVRLLIFGGEVCPPEVVEPLIRPGREVWNSYGPTETTVVACASRLLRNAPVRIGLPLDGWDLAVVDSHGFQVAEGVAGELVIGGVGLARYLDPAGGQDKFVEMPQLGWSRGYRTGDLVRYHADGLRYLGRTDDQIKLGGRRIELGEIDAALQALPGVLAAASAIRQTPVGTPVLVGYLVAPPRFDVPAAVKRLRRLLPDGTVPMIVLVDGLPTRTSGKVDRQALPWPVPSEQPAAQARTALGATAQWIASHWERILGRPAQNADDDFFAAGGSSLTAAILVSGLRERFPQATVADVYAHPQIGALAHRLDSLQPSLRLTARAVRPTGRPARIVQTLLAVPLAAVTSAKWLVWVLALNNLAAMFQLVGWAPTVSWWWLLAAALMFVSPPGIMALSVICARLLLFRIRPGDYPRGGAVHLRIWTAERLAEALGASALVGAPFVGCYARGLGARVGRDTDLHSLPPITGMLTLGPGCSINTEVDLSGHWLDGDVFHVGGIEVGSGAAVGSRSVLMPGTRIGPDAHIAAGSAVFGTVPSGAYWGGSPAARIPAEKHLWPSGRPQRSRRWDLGYALGAMLIGLLPVIAMAPVVLLLGWWLAGTATVHAAIPKTVVMVPVVTLLGLGTFIALTAVLVRLLGIGVTQGYHAVRGRIGWQVWCTEKLMDLARTIAYPLYSSMLTPSWLRLLGAKVGRGVEASTVLLLPKMTTVGSGAFLADDTMVGSYELAGGWLRIERSKVGRGAFLGNSGMTAPGRQVPKGGLVAVLSAAPARSRNGTSWLGSPPVQLRRSVPATDASRTYAPPLRLKVARAMVEICRLIPAAITVGLGLGVGFGIEWLLGSYGLSAAALLSGVLLLAGGAAAALISIAAKWLLVGRIRRAEQPLWSSFVWRNELTDSFVEMVAAAWLPKAAIGAPMLNWWLRGLGAHIGTGAWLETHWLPEADLVRLGDGATVNRGCVLQTHLFHDRILTMDSVELAAGATLGPHGIVLPASIIGANATVGPASLVMRGERVPPNTRWTGNPIAPWTAPPPAPDQRSAGSSRAA